MEKFTKTVLVADALNLGSHWVYDQAKLATLYSKGLTEFTSPNSPYHPNRVAGQFTHIGDQTLFLHQCLEANNGTYSLEQWRAWWIEKMSSYDGYIDSATKTTLASDAKTPSDSNEFAVLARIAPILDNSKDWLTDATSQANLTHGSPMINDAILFIILTVQEIEKGSDFATALQAASSFADFQHLPKSPILMIKEAFNKTPEMALETALEYGQACSLENALPLTIYLAIHHGSSFNECLDINALMGGDTSARACVLALLFAAKDPDTAAEFYPKLTLQ